MGHDDFKTLYRYKRADRQIGDRAQAARTHPISVPMTWSSRRCWVSP